MQVQDTRAVAERQRDQAEADARHERGNPRVDPPTSLLVFAGLPPLTPEELTEEFLPVEMPAMWDPISGWCEATTLWMPAEYVRGQERRAAAGARRDALRTAGEPEPEPAANDAPSVVEHIGTWTDEPAPASASPSKAPKPKAKRSWLPHVRKAARRLEPRMYAEIERHREDGTTSSALRGFAARVLKAKARAHDVADATIERLIGAGKIIRRQAGRLVRFIASVFASAAERAELAARHEQAGGEPSEGRRHGSSRRAASGRADAGIGAGSGRVTPRPQGRPRTRPGRNPAPTSFATHFWKKLEPPNARGCREWAGSVDRDGYGRVGKHDRAHRVAFEIHYGVRLPSELHVLHLCDNPTCCNPRHLAVGRHDDNMKDRKAKGRY